MNRFFILLSILQVSYAVTAQTQTDTLAKSQVMEEQVFNGIKANAAMPVTQYNLSRKQLEEIYYGADIPSVLMVSPSVNTYSDNGTGIGYSFFRLRGLDQSRINTTLNGIPVNDQEGQGTFFNNFADLLSSASEVQLQRGVGTSTNGTASIAGSLNITTKSLSMKPSFSFYSGFGTYGSRRLTAEYQSGLLYKKVAFYGRISDVATDGYRVYSGSHIQSLYFSGAYFGKRSVLKINIMNGLAESQLSYQGVDKATMDTARTTNYFVNKEQDAFRQTYYQLQYNYELNASSGFGLSVYYVKGNAPKFQYFLDGSYNTYAYMNMPDAIIGTDTFSTTDAIGSYRLNQDFAGIFGSYYYKKGNIDFLAGFHANQFISDHFMEVNWARIVPAGISQNHQAYFNTGMKKERNVFAKLTYSVSSKLSLFGDLQMRIASFTYEGKDLEFHRDTFDVEDMNWVFINPKVGFRYQFTRSLSLYGMFGNTSREPTRTDYFLDEFPHKDIRQEDLKPEQVQDLELGVQYEITPMVIHANLFWMNFSNQLINTGQLNAVGTPITTNVSNSYRRGIEIDFILKPWKKIWFTNSSSIMQNGIGSITQYFDSAAAYTTSVGIQYSNVSAALSPNIIVNQGVRYIPANWIFAEVNGRWVSKQYLDNTQDENLSINAFYYVDLKLVVNLEKWVGVGQPTFSIQCNNITNELYTPSGNITGNRIDYTTGVGVKSATGLYFPAATRNYFVTLGWKF